MQQRVALIHIMLPFKGAYECSVVRDARASLLSMTLCKTLSGNAKAYDDVANAKGKNQGTPPGGHAEEAAKSGRLEARPPKNSTPRATRHKKGHHPQTRKENA